MGIRPKKALGQHFLTDPGITRKILSRSGFDASDQVLEIGPGTGALTLPLARRVGHVVAVEKDSRLADLLAGRLSKAGISNVTLVNHDILKWNFENLDAFLSPKIKVIGNLPYNISTPFLEKLIDNRGMVSRAVLMFQEEVARRLTASPGNKIYGAMTLLVLYHAHSTILFEVPAKSFRPRPKVNSVVLEMDFERPYPMRVSSEEVFNRVVKAAFAHRRKTLLNSFRIHSPEWSDEILL